MKKTFVCGLILFLFGCSAGNEKKSISLLREKVNPVPIQEYREKVPDDLNDWFFAVQLFETDSTFNYMLRMQYKEVRGEQLIRFPNLGYEPKPVVKKGAYDKTVMVGFQDEKGKFMDYKMVYVVDEQMGIRSIKRYTIN